MNDGGGVNNEIEQREYQPLWEVPKATWDSVLSINVHGILNTMRHFVPAMASATHGFQRDRF